MQAVQSVTFPALAKIRDDAPKFAESYRELVADCSSKTPDIPLTEAINRLTDREKRILSLRFYEGKTQMQVAAEVGISQAQVSRLEKNAINQIKKDL